MSKGEQGRLRYGAAFGFLQSLMQAFAMIVPTFYFSSLSISIVVYAFLQSIADVFSFLAKPAVGHMTDVYGERKFLLATVPVFFVSLFLIGQTTSVAEITALKVVSGIASALLFVIIIIYGLRLVEKQPDRKVGLFGAIKSSGWIFGLLIPGLVIDKLGIGAGFNLILLLGIIWLVFIWRLTKKYELKPKLTMDLAVFSVFLFYFVRFGLQTLGLSRSVVTSVIIAELMAFVLSNYLVGRISNPGRRKYWIPVAILLHGLAAFTMVNAAQLAHYYLAGIFIGLAGGFVDVWIFSYLSESVRACDKGKAIGTFGWSYDFSTVIGAQLPVLFALLNQNIFASMFVFPALMLAAYAANYFLRR